MNEKFPNYKTTLDINLATNKTNKKIETKINDAIESFETQEQILLFKKIISTWDSSVITEKWIGTIVEIITIFDEIEDDNTPYQILDMTIEGLWKKAYTYFSSYDSVKTFSSLIIENQLNQQTIDAIKSLKADEDCIFISDEENQKIAFDSVRSQLYYFYSNIFKAWNNQSVRLLIEKWVVKTRSELALIQWLCEKDPNIIKSLLSLDNTQLSFEWYPYYNLSVSGLEKVHPVILETFDKYIKYKNIKSLSCILIWWNDNTSKNVYIWTYLKQINDIYLAWDEKNLDDDQIATVMNDFFPWFVDSMSTNTNLLTKYSFFWEHHKKNISLLFWLFLDNHEKYIDFKNIILRSDMQQENSLNYSIVYFSDIEELYNSSWMERINTLSDTVLKQVLMTRSTKQWIQSFMKSRQIENIEERYSHFILDTVLLNIWCKTLFLEKTNVQRIELEKYTDSLRYTQKMNHEIIYRGLDNIGKTLNSQWGWDWRWTEWEYWKILWIYLEEIRVFIKDVYPDFYESAITLRTKIIDTWVDVSFFADHIKAGKRDSKLPYLELVAESMRNNIDHITNIIDIAKVLYENTSPEIQAIKQNLIQQLHNNPNAKNIIISITDYFRYNSFPVFEVNCIFQHTNSKEVFDRKIEGTWNSRCHILSVLKNKDDYEKVREIFYVDSLKTLINSSPENIKDIVAIIDEWDELTEIIRTKGIETLTQSEKYYFFLFIKFCETILITSCLAYKPIQEITIENIWITYQQVFDALYCSPQKKPSETIAKRMLKPYWVKSFSHLLELSNNAIANANNQAIINWEFILSEWDIMKWVTSEYLSSYSTNWICAPEINWKNSTYDETYYGTDFWIIEAWDNDTTPQKILWEHISNKFGDLQIVIKDHQDLHRTYSKQKKEKHIENFNDPSLIEWYNPLSVSSSYEVSCSQFIDESRGFYLSHKDEYEIRHSVWRQRIDSFITKKNKHTDTQYCERLFFEIIRMWSYKKVFNESWEDILTTDSFVEKNKKLLLNPPTKVSIPDIFNQESTQWIEKNIDHIKTVKEALTISLDNPEDNAKLIMNIFKENNFFKQHFDQETWVDEKNNILWEHTLSVLKNYEKIFATLSDEKQQELFPKWSWISHEIMRLCIVLHDIGKGYALNTLGNNDLQHEVSKAMIYNIMETMWYSRREIRRVIAIVDQDLMLNIFSSTWDTKDIEIIANNIRSHAIRNHCEPETFFAILKLFTLVDWSTYDAFSESFNREKTGFSNQIQESLQKIGESLRKIQ